MTDVTGEGLLSRVSPHVDLDALLVSEALGTHLTGEGTLTCVGAHVSRQ